MSLFKILFVAFVFMASAIVFFTIKPVKKNAHEIINLNYNENPFGCSPWVHKAMQEALSHSAFYPDKEAEAFAAKLASYHAVEKKRLLVDHGLSSILHIVVEACLGNPKTLIMGDPTFDFIAIYAKERGGNIVKVPLKEDYSHDLEAMLKQIDASTQLIYICNPNNPTGTLTPRKQIENFLHKLPKNVYVFIDEAYHHFAASDDYISFIDKPILDDRIIVGRTFSKAYGLAGIRLGYAFSTPNTIEKLKKYQALDSNNRVALEAGLAALNDEAWLLSTVEKFDVIREEFYAQAKARGLKYIPSHANFIMLQTGGRAIQPILDHFAKHNIKLGREFPPMHEHVRISLGLPEQMKQFWLVWDQLP